MKTYVFYCKNPRTIRPEDIRPENLEATHTFLTVLSGECSAEEVFVHMQAENWSPNGEACFLIEQLGLHHTSMSVGDLLVRNGEAFYCDHIGFKKLAGKCDLSLIESTEKEVGGVGL